jgi:hypothetical protein
LSVEPVSRRQDLAGPAAVPRGAAPEATNAEPHAAESDTAPTGQPQPPPPQEAQQQVEQGVVQQEIARLSNSIDRLQSENALRQALLPPLATLAVYLSFAQKWVWGLALALVPAFLAQIVVRNGRISDESSAREQLIQTAKLVAVRALGSARTDRDTVRALKGVVSADLADAARVIDTVLERGQWPIGARKTWSETWEASRMQLARGLSAHEFEALSGAYALLSQLETGLTVERPGGERQITNTDQLYLGDARGRIASALTVLGQPLAEQG